MARAIWNMVRLTDLSVFLSSQHVTSLNLTYHGFFYHVTVTSKRLVVIKKSFVPKGAPDA